ncbi:hypothetical protein MHU86_9960 [Fragilaria crotonensis]|nr:hypothetical protein MHU86_9960 [Fragilaria crotonensis]
MRFSAIVFAVAVFLGAIEYVMADETPSSDNILRDLLDDDLISVARIANVVDPSLQTKADTFDANRIDELRVPLQRDTLAALAGASTVQTLDFLQQSPVLFMWNSRGDQIVDESTGKTTRQGLCELVSSTTSKVDQSIRDCLCGTADPFIRCQMMLGNQALAFGTARSASRTKPHHAHIRRVQGIPERKTQATCDLQFTPSNLMSAQPSFIELLNPPPLNVLEACGGVSVSIPSVEFLTLEGAQVQLDSGIIVKGSDALKEEAGDIDVALSLSICFALSEELEKVPGLEAILEYLGIDLCFAEQTFKMWPARGSAEFSLEVTVSIFKASIGLQWQTSTTLRDTLGLCDGVEPSCDDKDTFFCSMSEMAWSDSLIYWSTSIFIKKPYSRSPSARELIGIVRIYQMAQFASLVHPAKGAKTLRPTGMVQPSLPVELSLDMQTAQHASQDFRAKNVRIHQRIGMGPPYKSVAKSQSTKMAQHVSQDFRAKTASIHRRIGMDPPCRSVAKSQSTKTAQHASQSYLAKTA